MKILSIGNFHLPSWDGSIPDEEHIAGVLEELGHEVVRFQRGDIYKVDTSGVDLTLVAQWEGYGDTSWMPRPLVYWAFDYQNDSQEWHKRLIKEADLYLSKRIADSKHPNWQWLSQDFAPKFLDKYEEPTSVEKYEKPPLVKDIDVLFTGSYLDWATERNETIKAVNEKFKLVVHSVNDWPFLERKQPRMDHDLPELYARAKVILSIDHTIEAGYWSDRNAQIMACGGLVMFRYVPLSRSIFNDHIVYFHDVEDCLFRLEQLLERPQEDLDGVAEGGYRHAHEHMMVGDRVKDLITIIEGIL